MTLLLIYIALAIGVSFLCSILEAVLLSVTPSFIAGKEAEEPALAARLKTLKDDVDRPLAAILSLNTVAHTVGAAGAGAQAAAVFGDASITIFSAVLTFLILVLSEIIPKTIGATYWRSLAGFVARTLPWLILAMWPLVKMSQGITSLMGGKGEGGVSRDEVAALAEVAHREGAMAESESRIVRNLFRLDALTVEDVMTPRVVLAAMPESATAADAMAREDVMRFSRIPIYDEDVDHVTGFVLKADLLMEVAVDRPDTPLRDMRRDLARVPETLALRALFAALMEDGGHLALVVDAYGGTAGLVTQEDVVETLLGIEIVDEADGARDLRILARRRWEERAARIGHDLSAYETPLEKAAPAEPAPRRTPPDESERTEVALHGITGGTPPSAERD